MRHGVDSFAFGFGQWATDPYGIETDGLTISGGEPLYDTRVKLEPAWGTGR